MKMPGKLILFLLLCLFGTISAGDIEQGELKKTLKVGKNGFLEVYTTLGTIQIVPWDKNEMLIETKGLYGDDADKVKITQTGNIVKVSYEQGGHPDEVNFIISLPAQHNVTLSTSSGDIIVSGTLKGELKGSTSGGDIKLGRVEGLVNLNTSGGDITAGDILSNAAFSTSGGDISIGEVSGMAEVRTNGGDIKVKSVGEKLSATTYGGDIQIGSIEGDGQINTYGGDIHIESVSGNAEVNTAGGDIYLSGASGKVRANTQGGDITLNKISGSVDARTRSGSVIVEMLSAGKSRSTILASDGTVTLYLKEDIKATIDAKIRMRGWKKNAFHLTSEFDAKKNAGVDEDNNEIKATIPINGGGEIISIETANADIEIRKLGSRNKPGKPE